MARCNPTSAQKLRLLARRLLELADHFDVPSETTTQVDMLVGHVEQVSEEVRAVVRGPR